MGERAEEEREHIVSLPTYLKGRSLWKIHDFAFVDEAIIKSLVKYRSKKNRELVTDLQEADVSGSLMPDGKHMAILDLDFEHQYVESTEDGHAHLYLNVPISKFRWFLLMCGLRAARVVEPGFFMWSLRRGQNFARLPWVTKKESEKGDYTYGWFFKQRTRK